MPEISKTIGALENKNLERDDVWERRLADLIAYSRFRVFSHRRKLENISEKDINDEMVDTFKAVSRQIMEKPSDYLEQIGENPTDNDYDEFSDRLYREIYPNIFIKEAKQDKKIV